jgi:UDP-N-acetylglucosamine acyltransferase
MALHVATSASIDPRAELAESVEVGPYCVIGPDVSIGPGTRLLSHVTITGRVSVGRYNCIHPGTVIGGDPQDLSYRGEHTEVVIGDYNVIRECVTVNRGTSKEAGVTSLGSHCYLMACAHIAHDCRVGDYVVMANGTLLGGHVHVHEYASISGAVAVHHYTTVGSYSFVGGLSRVLHDVPPFMLAEGSPARPRCINIVALKRNEFPPDVVSALSDAHRLLYRAKVGLDHAREILRSEGKLLPQVNHLLSFIQNQQEGRHGRAREFRRAA